MNVYSFQIRPSQDHQPRSPFVNFLLPKSRQKYGKIMRKRLVVPIRMKMSGLKHRKSVITYAICFKEVSERAKSHLDLYKILNILQIFLYVFSIFSRESSARLQRKPIVCLKNQMIQNHLRKHHPLFLSRLAQQLLIQQSSVRKVHPVAEFILWSYCHLRLHV